MRKIILGLMVLVLVTGLFGQDSLLKDHIKLKDSVYYYKDKSDYIGSPTPTPTYYIDTLKCPNDTITYFKHDMKPLNRIVFCEHGDIGNYINGKKDGLHKKYYHDGKLYYEKNYKGGIIKDG